MRHKQRIVLRARRWPLHLATLILIPLAAIALVPASPLPAPSAAAKLVQKLGWVPVSRHWISCAPLNRDSFYLAETSESGFGFYVNTDADILVSGAVRSALQEGRIRLAQADLRCHPTRAPLTIEEIY